MVGLDNLITGKPYTLVGLDNLITGKPYTLVGLDNLITGKHWLALLKATCCLTEVRQPFPPHKGVIK